MAEHPYCIEHDQPLDWCEHPAALEPIYIVGMDYRVIGAMSQDELRQRLADAGITLVRMETGTTANCEDRQG